MNLYIRNKAMTIFNTSAIPAYEPQSKQKEIHYILQFMLHLIHYTATISDTTEYWTGHVENYNSHPAGYCFVNGKKLNEVRGW